MAVANELVSRYSGKRQKVVCSRKSSLVQGKDTYVEERNLRPDFGHKTGLPKDPFKEREGMTTIGEARSYC